MIGRDFNPGLIAVMSNTGFLEAVVEENFFSGLYLLEFGFRNMIAVRNARTQAGASRFIPVWQFKMIPIYLTKHTIKISYW